ncbi:MAG: tRNA (adenosine(37)-N6)-threonylcarbamoyltransferase complex dimerization subunit type 1 TsaB [Candidatus Acidiferrales bacterium]
MLILALDTSTPSGSVAVLEGNRLMGMVGTDMQETYSSRLFRQLDFLLRELSLEIKEIDLFAVVAGPGSFTGLRVGLTAVKGWGEVHGRPVAAISGLEAVAALAVGPVASGSPEAIHTGEPDRPGDSAGDRSYIAPVMDARRGQVYGGLYRRTAAGLVRHGDEVLMTAQEFVRELATRVGAQRVLFASPTPRVLTDALTGSALRGCGLEQVAAPLAATVGRLAWLKAQRGETVDALTLDANYIRRSDAELLWKG